MGITADGLPTIAPSENEDTRGGTRYEGRVSVAAHRLVEYEAQRRMPRRRHAMVVCVAWRSGCHQNGDTDPMAQWYIIPHGDVPRGN